MIINPITKGTTVSFRLVTGETLIANFVEMNLDRLTVTRPVVANPVQEGGNIGIYYSPFCATVDEDQEYRIPRSNILVEPMIPRDELKASYLKMMTGLDIPAGSSIL